MFEIPGLIHLHWAVSIADSSVDTSCCHSSCGTHETRDVEHKRNTQLLSCQKIEYHDRQLPLGDKVRCFSYLTSTVLVTLLSMEWPSLDETPVSLKVFSGTIWPLTTWLTKVRKPKSFAFNILFSNKLSHWLRPFIRWPLCTINLGGSNVTP